MRLGALAKLGKFGSRVDEYENRKEQPIIPQQTISVAPKSVFLHKQNYYTADVQVKTEVPWNVC